MIYRTDVGWAVSPRDQYSEIVGGSKPAYGCYQNGKWQEVIGNDWEDALDAYPRQSLRKIFFSSLETSLERRATVRFILAQQRSGIHVSGPQGGILDVSDGRKTVTANIGGLGYWNGEYREPRLRR